jgi:hypothetical protein
MPFPFGPASYLAAGVCLWIHRLSCNLPEGSVISTPRTVYIGFGFDSTDNASGRKDWMDSTMSYPGQYGLS